MSEQALLSSVVTPIMKKSSKHDITMKGKLYSFKMEPCCRGGISLTYSTLHDAPQGPLAMLSMGGMGKDGKIEVPVIARQAHTKWYDRFLGISLSWRCKRELKALKRAFKNTEIQEQVTNQMREEFERGV